MGDGEEGGYSLYIFSGGGGHNPPPPPKKWFLNKKKFSGGEERRVEWGRQVLVFIFRGGLSMHNLNKINISDNYIMYKGRHA